MSNEFNLGLCRLESTRGNVERSPPRSMSWGVCSGRWWKKSARVNVERNRLGLISTQNRPEPFLIEVYLGWCRVEPARIDVDRSRHEPMSSVAGPGQSRQVLAWAVFWSQPVSMSSRVCPGQCRPKSTRADVDLGWFWVELARVNVEWSQPGPKSTSVDASRCRAKMVWVEVNQYWPRPIFEVGHGRCCGESGQVDGERSRVRSMWSVFDPSLCWVCPNWCRVELARVDVDPEST